MPVAQIDFDEWTPDRPSFRKGRMRDVKNVVPGAEGYEPFRGLAPQSQALAAQPLGAASARDASAVIHTYAGTTAALYELTSTGSWTDRSKAGGYTTGATNRWRFTQYGDRMIAVNGTDNPQYATMSTSSAFANLSTAPIAYYVATMGEFVFLGRLASNAFKIRWSAIGDSDGWTIGTNQSDEQLLAEGGIVTGLASGDVLTVFQERAIRRVAYVGPPLIMQVDTISSELGCTTPGSICQLGRIIFFLSDTGFYMFDGQQMTPIGIEKVDEWFRADFSPAGVSKMSSAVYPQLKVVMWAYPSVNSASGENDTILMYNWTSGRWSYARTRVDALFTNLSLGLTLEQLDALYGNLDAIPLSISLDDPAFTGGVQLLGALGSDRTLGYFTGTPMEGSFTTDDFSIGPGRITRVHAIRPLVDGGTLYGSTSWKMAPDDAFATATETLVDRTGSAPQRAVGRFVRFNVRIASGGGWTQAQGIEVDVADAGAR